MKKKLNKKHVAITGAVMLSVGLGLYLISRRG